MGEGGGSGCRALFSSFFQHPHLYRYFSYVAVTRMELNQELEIVDGFLLVSLS